MPKYSVEYENYKGEQTTSIICADDEAAALGLCLDIHDDVPEKKAAPKFTVQRVTRVKKGGTE